MNANQYASFLESLKVNDEGPGEMHGIRFDVALDFFTHLIKYPKDFSEKQLREYLEYFQERCRRAESNAKPSDLAEQVKRAVRAAVAAETMHRFDTSDAKAEMVCRRFRRLSEAKP